MEYFNVEELGARSRDVINNQINLTEDGKIGFVPMDDWGDYVMQVWAHVLEECQLRSYSFPYPLDQVKDWQFPNHSWPGLQKAVEVTKLEIG